MVNGEAKTPITAQTEPYQRTAEEKAAVSAFHSQKTTPFLTMDKNAEKLMVEYDHPDSLTGQALLMQSLATTEFAFLHGVLRQVISAGTQDAVYDGKGPNFMLSVMAGVSPQDQIETMLAAQMAAVHMASMAFAHRLAHAGNIPQQDSASTAFNKLARTFAVQMEALKRYRTGGEQRMTVQHVTVNDGGQAIVGTVSAGQGGGATGEKPEATP